MTEVATKEALAAGRSIAETANKLGVPVDCLEAYLDVIGTASVCGRGTMSERSVVASRVLNRLMNKHFSDMRDGVPEPEDERAFIRDLFAAVRAKKA